MLHLSFIGCAEHLPARGGDGGQTPPPRPRAPGASAAAAGPPDGARVAHAYPQQDGGGAGGLLGRALSLPFAVVRLALGAAASAARLGLSLAAAAGDAVLPAGVMRRARALAGAVAELGAPPPDPAEQAAAFAEAYAATYGAGAGPEWLRAGWSQAATEAHRRFKFLFAYLHSPDHPDADAFCRGVLSDDGVRAFVGEHFVAWGGDVRRADAFTVRRGRRGRRRERERLLCRWARACRQPSSRAPVANLFFPGLLSSPNHNPSKPPAALGAPVRDDLPLRRAARVPGRARQGRRVRAGRRDGGAAARGAAARGRRARRAARGGAAAGGGAGALLARSALCLVFALARVFLSACCFSSRQQKSPSLCTTPTA